MSEEIFWWVCPEGGVLNGGRDGVKDIVNLVLDERVWEKDDGKVSIICR